MLLDKSFVGVYQPTPVSLLEDFRALLTSRNAAPRQPGWHKASSPAFYTGHDSRETNPRRAGQEYQGHLPGPHRARNHSYVLSAWIPHVGTCLQFGYEPAGGRWADGCRSHADWGPGPPAPGWHVSQRYVNWRRRKVKEEEEEEEEGLFRGRCPRAALLRHRDGLTECLATSG